MKAFPAKLLLFTGLPVYKAKLGTFDDLINTVCINSGNHNVLEIGLCFLHTLFGHEHAIYFNAHTWLHFK